MLKLADVEKKKNVNINRITIYQWYLYCYVYHLGSIYQWSSLIKLNNQQNQNRGARAMNNSNEINGGSANGEKKVTNIIYQATWKCVYVCGMSSIQARRLCRHIFIWNSERFFFFFFNYRAQVNNILWSFILRMLLLSLYGESMHTHSYLLARTHKLIPM